MLQILWLARLREQWLGKILRSSRKRRRPATRQRLHRRLHLEALEDRTLLAASWTAIGPAPIDNGQVAGGGAVSGRITGIATDPGNSSIIYIASAGGGIWKSINGGASWTPLTDNLTDGQGNPLPEFMGAVAETDATSGIHSGNQIVYAGMGEANNSGDSFYGDGILVSTNGGTSWRLTNAGGALKGMAVSKIVVDPSDTTGGTAYAAVSNFAVNGTFTNNAGIWKTINFGQTWTNTTSAAGPLSTSNQWSDVVVDPKTPTTLYAAEGNPNGNLGNGVYKSTNGGATWSLLSKGPQGTNTGRMALALYDDGTTNELVVSVSSSAAATFGQLAQMVKSTDGGASFSTLTVPNYMGATQFGQNFGQGWYDTTLAITAPTTGAINTNTLYIYAGGSDNGGSNGNVESFDGGATWQSITQDSSGNGPHSDDHAVAFDASGNLLDGNDGGVFRLFDPTSAANQLWFNLNTNLQITQFTGVAANPNNSNIVYGGSQDNGTEEYTGIVGWNLLIGGDGGFTRVDPTNTNIVYQEFTSVSLEVSTNGGATFSSITSGAQANFSNFYAPYVLDSSGNVYYGTDNLNFLSKSNLFSEINFGNQWTQIGTPKINGFNPNDNPIDAIAVSPTNNNVVYVSAGGSMFVTRNAQAGGSSVTWTEINLPNGWGASAGNSIVVDQTDPTGATAYAVVNSFTGGGNHVFKTTNFGSIWTDISGNLPDMPVDSVAVGAGGKTVYVGTDAGVYSTTNGGTTWALYGTGFPHAQVVELDYVSSLNLLLAGTHGRGAWEAPVDVAPTVTLNPKNDTVLQGQTAIFTAAASGFPSPNVQWQVSTDGGNTWANLIDGPFNGSTISGATTDTLTITNAQPSEDGDEFRAVFTNIAGSATTTAATLTVHYAPIVTANPTNESLQVGQTATFTAAANGDPKPNVQWQVSSDGGTTWTSIVGANFTTLTINNVLVSMSGNEYRAAFTNIINGTVNTATTSTASLTVSVASVNTTAVPASATYSTNSQTIKLNANVLDAIAPGFGVNEGTATFTVEDGGGNTVGTAKAGVSGGTASAQFVVPGGLAAGNYIILVRYNDSTGSNFTEGIDTGSTLSIVAANVTTATTNLTAAYSANTQKLNLSASVSDTSNSNDPVNEGFVKFTITDSGGNPVGTTQAGVSGGTATATNFKLPAGEGLGIYTIAVSYQDTNNANGVVNFTDAGDKGATLTIVPAKVTIAASPASLTFSTTAQTVQLNATVTDTSIPNDPVGEGIVTFTIMDGTTIIGNAFGTVTATANGGTATLDPKNLFPWSAGRAAGNYTIAVSYQDNLTGNYVDSGDSGNTLAVAAANVTTTVTTSPTLIVSSNAQTVALSAAVSDAAGDAVNEGTVTFAVKDSGGNTIGTAQGNVLATANGNIANASFSVPKGTTAGSYTIVGSYQDSLNANGVVNFFDNPINDTPGALTIKPANVITTANNVSALYSSNAQTLNLSASVANSSFPANTVSEGIVTFTIKDGNGNTVLSQAGNVSGGSASTTVNLPAGLAAGNYTIAVGYSDKVNNAILNNFIDAGDNSAKLTIMHVNAVIQANAVTIAYSPNPQTLALSAIVTNTSNSKDPIDEGTVTFTVKDGGGKTIGTAQGSVTAGTATANNFALPAGEALGSYMIGVSYSDGPGNNVLDSGDTSGTLKITPANVTIAANSVLATYSPNPNGQIVVLSAAVDDASISTDPVNEGTVTFTISHGSTIIGSVPGGVTANTGGAGGGKASANFTLPPGLAAGSYVIGVSYNDSTGHFLDSGDKVAILNIAPANVTITANNVSPAFSPNARTVMLGATVADASIPGDTVSQGSVTFTVEDSGGKTLGTATGLVTGGNVSAGFNLPAGQAIGIYNIGVSYSISTNVNGTANFTDNGTGDTPGMLNITAAGVTTKANNVSTDFSIHSQTVTLSAKLTDTGVPGDTVTGGIVTFTISDGSGIIGTAQGNVSNGTASTKVGLSAGFSAGSYTIGVSYSDSPSTNFVDGGDTVGTLTVTPASVTTTATSTSTTYSAGAQELALSAAVTDPGPAINVVNEGFVTFTIKVGSTVIGSVPAAVNNGAANANFTLPPGLAAGSYTITVGYSDLGGNFADTGDAGATLTVGTAATTTQLIAAFITPNYSNLTVAETLAAHVSSSSTVTSGIVTFALSGQTITANVDSNGVAVVTLNLPMQTLLGPQAINVAYTDPAHNLKSSSTAKTASWQLSNPLVPTTTKFTDKGEVVTVDLFGLSISFTNGVLTEIDGDGIDLVFVYSASGQLIGATVDGMNLLT